MKTTKTDPKSTEQLAKDLSRCRVRAPDAFCDQVMQAITAGAKRDQVIPLRTRWWPAHGAWLAPALVGAAAMLLVGLGLQLFLAQETPAPSAPHRMLVTFQLHAPDAHRVELAGSFNDWDVNSIELTGPDATGHWSVEVPLPEGRHEYLFLVDGDKWITDPAATTYRDDGFGSRNAVLEL